MLKRKETEKPAEPGYSWRHVGMHDDEKYGDVHKFGLFSPKGEQVGGFNVSAEFYKDEPISWQLLGGNIHKDHRENIPDLPVPVAFEAIRAHYKNTGRRMPDLANEDYNDEILRHHNIKVGEMTALDFIKEASKPPSDALREHDIDLQAISEHLHHDKSRPLLDKVLGKLKGEATGAALRKRVIGEHLEDFKRNLASSKFDSWAAAGAKR